MKTATKFFPLMIMVLIIGLASNVSAQGRVQQKGKERDRAGNHEWSDHGKDKHDRDHNLKSHHHAYGKSDRHRRHHHERHFAHDHNRHCVHARAVRKHHEIPRYVYYRDYDVYFDTQQSVYITWSGRSWESSSSLPVVLRRVDRQRAVRIEVDYYHDNFTSYLSAGRPAYRRIYTGL